MRQSQAVHRQRDQRQQRTLPTAHPRTGSHVGGIIGLACSIPSAFAASDAGWIGFQQKKPNQSSQY